MKYDFGGWNVGEFIKGRDKLLIALIGSCVGWLITQNPVYTGIWTAVAELAYAIIRYYVKA